VSICVYICPSLYTMRSDNVQAATELSMSMHFHSLSVIHNPVTITKDR
jgi:hypothetical protein